MVKELETMEEVVEMFEEKVATRNKKRTIKDSRKRKELIKMLGFDSEGVISIEDVKMAEKFLRRK